VALSEHEQSQLDEIERGLFSPDQTVTTAPPSTARARLSLRRPILAVGGIAAGMTLVLVGLVGNIVVVSVLGFIVIVGAVATARINPDGIRARLSASVSAQTRKLADGDRRSEKRQPPRSMDDA
jgi:Protein of unknown function (DUF3040)